MEKELNELLAKRQAEVKTMTTEDLQKLLDEQLADENEDFMLFDCLFAVEELKRRRGELDTPEQQLQWKMTAEYYYPVSLREDEELTDPGTGILLTPSWHGENCAGNGEQGRECCCDECEHYLACFPETQTGRIWDEDTQRFI